MTEISNVSNQETSLDTASATSSPASAGGRQLLLWQDGPRIDPCGPALARASRSASLANAKARPTSGTCGPSSSGSSASADLQRCLASRLAAAMDVSGSMEYSLTWKELITPAGRRICRLRASNRHRSVKGCSGSRNGAKGSNASLRVAATQIQLTPWPTATVNDSRSGRNRTAVRKNKDSKHHDGLTLTDAAVLAGWATPQACDSRGATGKTSTFNDLGKQVQSSTAETISIGELVLNAAMSRWLMGYPAVWDEASPNYDAWSAVQERIASGG
jgi:hypothetical protein